MCLLYLAAVLLCKLLAFDEARLCEVWLSPCKHNATVGANADLFILWTASLFFFLCVSLLVGVPTLFLDITDCTWTQQYVFKPNFAFQ